MVSSDVSASHEELTELRKQVHSLELDNNNFRQRVDSTAQEKDNTISQLQEELKIMQEKMNSVTNELDGANNLVTNMQETIEKKVIFFAFQIVTRVLPLRYFKGSMSLPPAPLAQSTSLDDLVLVSLLVDT